MAVEKQEGRVVGLAVTREISKRALPANPVWDTREPNDFDDFGAEYTKVARSPFSQNRQRRKGNITDRDDRFGWNEDLTQNNMQERLEEFLFANMRATPKVADYQPEYAKAFTVVAATDVFTTVAHGLTTGDGPFNVSSATTLPAGLNGATLYWVIVLSANTFKLATTRANAVAGVPVAVDVTDAGTGIHTMTRTGAVDATTDAYIVNDGTGFVANGLVLAQNFTGTGNNGLKKLLTATASALAIDGVLASEVTAPANASVTLVGYEFDAGDVTIVRDGETVVFASASVDFNDLPLIPGQIIFVGGDAAGTRFDDVVPGYARIGVDGIAEDGSSLTFDKTTFSVPADLDDDGAAKTIRIFFGDTVKNEDDPDLIVRHTIQAERYLGRDDDGYQSEYLEGGVANELTFNSPLADKVTFDLGYIAMYYGKRPGALGPKSREVGVVLNKALGEDAFNTTSNLYRVRLTILDGTLNPTSLFARVTDWTVTIANNTTGDKAQGTLGAFDTTSGLFEVDAEVTAYFTTVAAIQSIEDNADVTFDAIYSKKNAAIYMDIPLAGNGGGGLDISQDEAIKLPLETAAAESPFGHTVMFGFLPYVPNVGMASA
jgi:hypothetical protein